MAVELAENDMTAAEVKAAIMRLGLLREGIEGQFAKYVEVVSTMYQRRAWVADGTGSWDAFAAKHDIPVNLPREDRQAVSVALSAAGMSTRAIAVTQGVSNKTVHADIAGSGVTRGNTSVGTDGKTYTHPPPRHVDGAPASGVADSEPRSSPTMAEAEALTQGIRDQLREAHTGLLAACGWLLSNRVDAAIIVMALTRAKIAAHDQMPNEAGHLAVTALFDPVIAQIVDPATTEAWRSEWDHSTFHHPTATEISEVLSGIEALGLNLADAEKDQAEVERSSRG